MLINPCGFLIRVEACLVPACPGYVALIFLKRSQRIRKLLTFGFTAKERRSLLSQQHHLFDLVEIFRRQAIEIYAGSMTLGIPQHLMKSCRHFRLDRFFNFLAESVVDGQRHITGRCARRYAVSRGANTTRRQRRSRGGNDADFVIKFSPTEKKSHRIFIHPKTKRRSHSMRSPSLCRSCDGRREKGEGRRARLSPFALRPSPFALRPSILYCNSTIFFVCTDPCASIWYRYVPLDS